MKFSSVVFLLATAATAQDLPTLNRQECEAYPGTIVGDIGDGAISQPDYRCPGTNEPPVAKIVPADGEPIATEGEVCCAIETATADVNEESTTSSSQNVVQGVVTAVPTLNRQECEAYPGTIVGDIGDGAISQPDYRCPGTNEPPVAKIVPADGEPIATEGEVCCAIETATADVNEESTTSSSQNVVQGVVTAVSSVLLTMLFAAER